MLMRLDINKALFWLIKTPPGKKKHQKQKEKKPWDHFDKPLSFLMVFVWHRIQFSKPKYKFCTYTAENCSNL